jgi:aspartate kinase
LRFRYPKIRSISLVPVIVAKFGGSALGVDGRSISQIITRIMQISKKSKVVAVFSAPLTIYADKISSMTDVAINIGRSYASSAPLDLDSMLQVYRKIANKYLNNSYSNAFQNHLDEFNHRIIISLKQAAENRRFVDVIRSRTLAYAGEITMSYLMDFIMRSNGIRSDHADIDNWPIITDDNFEAANFILEESKHHVNHFIDLIERNDVVSVGGFIGKTVDGLETTYERGGSDRTAADIAILLHENYDVSMDFGKDNAVLSADPKIVFNNLESVEYLSYNEARLAGMFGMKILDPVAIKEINDYNLDIPIAITNMNDPTKKTTIRKDVPVTDDENFVKMITGKRNCSIVRMDSNAASHLIASLEKEKMYHDYIKLSPYIQDDIEITRLLFLDADYVRRHERFIRAYDPETKIVYGRGAVTLIGDMMWKIPGIVSSVSHTVGDHHINILNLDAQEETSRILIIVEDKDTIVGDTVKAIHEQRKQILDGVSI